MRLPRRSAPRKGFFPMALPNRCKKMIAKFVNCEAL